MVQLFIIRVSADAKRQSFNAKLTDTMIQKFRP
jgi:hypothetical protein